MSNESPYRESLNEALTELVGDDYVVEYMLYMFDEQVEAGSVVPDKGEGFEWEYSEIERPIPRERVVDALQEFVGDDALVETMLYAFDETMTAARKVTEEEAAKRDLQEIVWDPRGTIRFRENNMVTALQEEGPSAVTKGMGDWAGNQTFLAWPPGWELDQFKKLVREKNGIILWLLQNAPADMNRLAMQDFSQKDKEQFAMLIGYSVSGAGDLSYFSPAMIHRADIIADRMITERDAK